VSSFAFAVPGYLLLLALLLPLGGWALVRAQRQERELIGRYGDEALLGQSSVLPSPRGRRLSLALRLGAIALLLLALARPQYGERQTGMAQSGRDVLVLLDLSRSMNAADAGTTRLAIAKQAVDQLLAESPHNRVGLIVFGGSAFLQLPLTTNYAAFRRYLDAASTDDLGDPGTDLANALMAAATVFEHDGERGYQSVLLLSDGENGPGEIAAPLTRLSRARIPVFAIGIGSPEGAPVPADSTEAPERWHRDHIGRIVVSKLEEGDLRRAARETGGSYQRWSATAARSIALELSRSSHRSMTAGESFERVDRFQWPLGLAVVLLLVEPVVRRRSRRRIA
jgi:Ca-activated chloride channel homolog